MSDKIIENNQVSVMGKIASQFTYEDIKIENYVSHPHIKAEVAV